MTTRFPRINLLLATAMILLSALSCPAVEPTTGPAPDSFRGIAWGERLEAHPGLVPVGGRGFQGAFHRQDEDLTMDEAAIVSVAYYFRDGRFTGAGVVFRGEANLFLIKSALMKRHGPGRGLGDRHGWTWPNFSLEIRFDPATETGALVYAFEGPLPEEG